MARTTTYTSSFTLYVPEEIHFFMKKEALFGKTTMKAWVIEAIDELLTERKEWKPQKEWHLPFQFYAAVPTQMETNQFYFGCDDNYAGILREQAAEDGIPVQNLIWTAIWRQYDKTQSEENEAPE